MLRDVVSWWGFGGGVGVVLFPVLARPCLPFLVRPWLLLLSLLRALCRYFRLEDFCPLCGSSVIIIGDGISNGSGVSGGCIVVVDGGGFDSGS